jgi:hypothetical protein
VQDEGSNSLRDNLIYIVVLEIFCLKKGDVASPFLFFSRKPFHFTKNLKADNQLNMIKRYLLTLLLLLISSCSYFNTEQNEAPKIKAVTGRIYFMGGESFTSIGLNAFNGPTYALLAKDEMLKKLNNLQNSIVTVKGYIDAEVMYPQKSIIVEEYKKLDLEKVTGKLHKSGLGSGAVYYLQTKEKAYNIIYDKFVEIGNLLEDVIELKGYIFKVDENSIDNIYLISVKKTQE